MADAIMGKSRLTAALHPLSLHFGQPLAPSHLRPHVAKVPQQRKIAKPPCCRSKIILNKRLNFDPPFENGRGDGLRDGQAAEYAVPKSVPRHAGARQRNWRIAA